MIHPLFRKPRFYLGFCVLLWGIAGGCSQPHTNSVPAADTAAGGSEVHNPDDNNDGETGTNPGDDNTGDDNSENGTGVDNPDTGTDDNGTTNDGGDACAAVNAAAQNVTLPVDIIWVIDASPSMDEEITLIEANLNAFVDQITDSGLDYHVILIGSDSQHYDASVQHSYYEICVPPPLSGAAGCPDTDSDNYLHVRRGVHSSDGLDIAASTYSQYQHFLRPEALAHMVIVTDDNVGWGMNGNEFMDFVANATEPGFPNGLKFHSIVETIAYDPNCAFDDNCSCGWEKGTDYIDLSESTGGLVHSVCSEDWNPIFDALAENLLEGTAMPCDFLIPEPGPNLEVDPGETNVVLVSEDGLERTTLLNVVGANMCEGQTWYFDDLDNPTTVHLCPAACGAISGSVEIEFGCETVKH
ncbi:MAG: hypothetical protein HOI23_22315 [Deltaproteobacteria bacterium]|jgi:hypothetical protein|nr:hypothetical protein [Deltaproteobacteria bacterium]MBT6431636.1 hypothetical protein [Deltaproteobacteria bacterium]MBT6489259.1 hypothetical protein [Deltaproteobacteria bacterium]